MHTPSESTLAQLLVERFPSIEQVRFANSGTEANMLAISCAQKYTGRERVMVFEGGYHGSLLCGFSRKEVRGLGVGDPATKRLLRAPFDFVVGPYNDLEETRRLATEAGQDLACIVVEPMLGSFLSCSPSRPRALILYVFLAPFDRRRRVYPRRSRLPARSPSTGDRPRSGPDL